MSLDQISQNDRTRLTQWIDAGVKVSQEIADLKEGLKDTTKELADEFGVKPAVLNKALRTAIKANINEQQESLDQVQSILVAVGRA